MPASIRLDWYNFVEDWVIESILLGIWDSETH